MRGRHAAKFGAELRFEQFTILEPAAARGSMDFGGDFLINDNPADPGTGGEAFATFMQGIPRRRIDYQRDPKHHL